MIISPITARAIASETARDPILARIKQFTLSGWPEYLKEENYNRIFNVELNCLWIKIVFYGEHVL